MTEAERLRKLEIDCARTELDSIVIPQCTLTPKPDKTFAMFWLIIIAAAILGTILVIKYGGWALGDPIPPPPPTPFITSAISTSAHTVHLVLYKGPAAVQLERYRPQDSTTYTFTTTLKEVDDTDLERDTLYRYRARYMPGPWSPPKEARTLALVDALNKGPLTFSDRDNDAWAGYCVVQRFRCSFP
jgi:hypothetical protein